MQRKGGKTIRLTPVDDDRQVTDHPARASMEALTDQKLFAQRIKSERASAYWFAASLWGVTGLAMGALLGVVLTMMVQTGSVPFIRDNIVAGAAIRDANDTVRNRPGMLTEPQDQQQPQTRP